jgi:pyruvate-formate lyase-activating enzyme
MDILMEPKNKPVKPSPGLFGLRKTLSIVVTTRCPLRCAHCGIGIYGEPRDVPLAKLNEDDIREAIRAVHSLGYTLVNFVGGEPFLAMDLLAAGVEECKSLGMKSTVVTAPVWASTKEKAKEALAKLPGLGAILLSYDKYHLEFLEMKHYENAVNAASEQGVELVFNVCKSSDDGKQIVKEQLAPLMDRAMGIQFQQILPVGNPKDFPKSIPLNGVTIKEAADLDKLERTCLIGTAALGLYKDVFACCWAMAIMNAPIRFDRNRSGNFKDDFSRIERDPNVRALMKTGVLNRLTGEKKEKVFERVKNKKFVNECHLCLYLMDIAKGKLWKKYVNVQDQPANRDIKIGMEIKRR